MAFILLIGTYIAVCVLHGYLNLHTFLNSTGYIVLYLNNQHNLFEERTQPMKKKMTITIDSDMYEWLEMIAHKESRSISNFVTVLIRKAFKKHYKETT